MEASKILERLKADVLKQAAKLLNKAAKVEEQPEAIVRARRISDQFDLLLIGDFGGGGFDKIVIASFDDGGSEFLAQVKVPSESDMFGQVSERAVQYSRYLGAELISQLDKTTREDIAEEIARGLEENIGMDAIAQRLEDIYSFSPERAKLIAMNEIAVANNAGVLEGMRVLRDAGAKIKKGWNPDDKACEVCLENAEDGFIDLDDTFSSGDLAPTAHPRCRCNLISEIED